MKLATVLSFLITSAFTAPLEDNPETIKKLYSVKEDIGSVELFLVAVEKPDLFSKDNDPIVEASSESSLPIFAHEDRAIGRYSLYGDPYENTPAYKPVIPSYPIASEVAATFDNALAKSAIPVLLSCAPNVVPGYLVESHPPAYRNAASDIDMLAEILSPGSPSSIFDLSGILNVNAISSLLSPEGKRKKRSSWIETGATHYRVSADYPEMHQGNQHRVSKDYPQPNMIRVSE